MAQVMRNLRIIFGNIRLHISRLDTILPLEKQKTVIQTDYGGTICKKLGPAKS